MRVGDRTIFRRAESLLKDESSQVGKMSVDDVKHETIRGLKVGKNS